MDLNHKSNRERSSSAKWASDVHLAVEYLKRQHDVVEWLEHAMDRTFPTHDLQELLKSGIVLRELMAHFAPTTATPKPIARTYSATMAPWKERENISVFLSDCRRLGMSECSLFGTDDLYEGTNMVQVVFGMQYIKAWFSGGVRSPRSPKNAPVGVWSFSESQVQDVLAQFQKHKSQECLLQGFLTRQGSSNCNLRQPEHASAHRSQEAVICTNDLNTPVDRVQDPPPSIFPTEETEASVELGPHCHKFTSCEPLLDTAPIKVQANDNVLAQPCESVIAPPTHRDGDDAMGTPTEQYVLATTPILTDPASDQVAVTSSDIVIVPVRTPQSLNVIRDFQSL
ncbi:hypothetical protein, variant [Aphanomyces invadans]|uniref:Calponin-homology (CH) domain-containing protein n=1 Tax=Aphanomyces invadans TaxID=157072 RepID=A0A024T8H5_9STRA|nr:hypothetical protein, variant [Aphanomyces invadans]ETV90390.1 hypothetical protein, variant [Aphanomyces invadans]|eukprot:XP_008880972.1 hypothetical protein, variant [Aphanomyces invadans]